MSNSEVRHIVGYGFNVANLALQITTTPLELINSYVNAVAPNTQIKTFQELAKQDRVSGGIMCPASETDALLKQMKEKGVGVDSPLKEGVLVMRYADDHGNVYSKMFWDSQYDAQAKSAIRAWECEKMQGAVGFDYLESYGNNRVMEVTGVSPSKIHMMQELAKKNDFRFSMQGPENNTYTLYFAQKDMNVAQQLYQEVDIMHYTDKSHLYERAYEFHEKQFSELKDVLLYNKDPQTNKSLENGCVIVDKNGSELHLNSKYIDCVSPDKEKVTLYRKDKDTFSREAVTALCSLEQPVLLSEKQYQEYKDLSDEQKTEFLINQEREKGLPDISISELEELAKLRETNRRIEEKLKENQESVVKVEVSAFEQEASFLSFKEREKQNYEELCEREKNNSQIPEDKLDEIVKDIQAEEGSFQPKRTKYTTQQYYLEGFVLDGREEHVSEIEGFNQETELAKDLDINDISETEILDGETEEDLDME